MDLKIAGKNALVLGSTRGIGNACAKVLAEEGCRLTVCGRSADTVEKARRDLSGSGHDGIVVDLSDRTSVKALVMAIESGDLLVDILVNNTGGPPLQKIVETSLEDWETNVRSMLYPIFEITSAALRGMTERRWGRIITIVSSGVIQPIVGLGISNALRSSIVGWSKTLSEEVAPSGITVNCVIPGRIRTQRVQQVDEVRAEALGVSLEEMCQHSVAAIPMGRYGEPEEIASAVGFLASGLSSYMTGSMIRVDGGSIRSL
ncbi:SDR family oxidoreductase [Ensifer sp. YR511]|uniref:SDR family oxidoreductase n=1 Tax=Ensifer sp. YR511 TaxID=1855294 RepID=UPI00088BB3DD|nr:SDR family oxidoreductase [Ensifer sp. YR511]SDN41310.1 3-oxoacyl-[acyl-carrier protein] reductase [Ensifer sp. YR511]